MENLGKRTGTTNARIINRIHEMEEIISIVEETIEEIDASVKESVSYKIPDSNHLENQ